MNSCRRRRGPASGSPRRERGDVVERHEVDPVELGMRADRRRPRRQVVGRRQALFLGAVARVCLDALVEELAGERREELVRRDAAEAADRVTTKAPGALRTEVDVGALEGERVADAEDPVAERAASARRQLVEDRDEVAGGDVARPEPGREGQDARDRRPASAPSYRAASTSRVSGLRAASGSSVRSTTATGSSIPEAAAQRVGGERPERGDRDAARRAGPRAEVVDDGRGPCRPWCPSRRGSRSRRRCGRRRSGRTGDR